VSRFERRDLPLLIALSVLGGAVAPVCLLVGLERMTGVAGSLLLNLEAPLTVLVAVVFFGERGSPRLLGAGAAVVAGAVVLESGGGWNHVSIVGVFAVAAACLAWAIDNNLSQRLAVRDTIRLVQVKTATASLGLVAVAVVSEQRFPAGRFLLAALAVGAASYGVSIWLDVIALRELGASREAALFATAPFAGALLSIPLLGEQVKVTFLIAGLLMAFGMLLLLRDRHHHDHVHGWLEHEHRHAHDVHHQHHEDEVGVHTHLHRHEPMRHHHDHLPDPHHRHDH
jgi:drug/metabolite transporter (DMT)-like permease